MRRRGPRAAAGCSVCPTVFEGAEERGRVLWVGPSLRHGVSHKLIQRRQVQIRTVDVERRMAFKAGTKGVLGRRAFGYLEQLEELRLPGRRTVGEALAEIRL